MYSFETVNVKTQGVSTGNGVFMKEKKKDCAVLFSVAYARNPVAHFASVINSALKGVGTNEARLIRTLITRSEVGHLEYDSTRP